LVASEVVAEGN